jgi:hypothetical protein
MPSCILDRRSGATKNYLAFLVQRYHTQSAAITTSLAVRSPINMQSSTPFDKEHRNFWMRLTFSRGLAGTQAPFRQLRSG